MLTKLLLYYHTLKYLKIKQFYYRLFYTFRRKWRTIFGFSYSYNQNAPSFRNLNLKALPIQPTSWINGKTFRFLNIEQQFDSEIDWNYDKHKKLWTYNLNYFEWLLQKDFPQGEGLLQIENYIHKLPYAKDGLEPFPTALRLMNWVKFLDKHNIKNALIEQSIYVQGQILLDQLEYHLLGNHLLENGFALLFLAVSFEDERFYRKAKQILTEELDEQILRDGGHFELSTMYHQLMTHRVLDAVNVVQQTSWKAKELTAMLSEKAGQMLGWLEEMTFKDGSIPLFNDAAKNIAITTSQLFEYAKELGLSRFNITLSESGYRKKSFNEYECIIDVGAIGPDYIPGHAHSDMFSFELHIKGEPVVVDTGTSTYNVGEEREYQRSTMAHNTVEVNNKDQSEVWGGFRVARRAKIIELKENGMYTASHNGYKRYGVIHQRMFQFDERSIIFEDNLIGKKVNIAKAFLHFHPSVDVQLVGDEIVSDNFNIEFTGAEKIELVPFDYAPEFNLSQRSQKAIIYFKANLQTILTVN